MSLLEWRDARPADQPALAAFQCTERPTKMKQRPWREIHPRPWELSLQREIHQLSPRCNARRAVLLGWDDEGLATVTAAELLRDEGEAIIECVAVASRRRRAGGSGCADEALEQTVEWAISRADSAGLSRQLVIAKTHPENVHGASLLLRNGFGIARADDAAVWFQQQIII